MRAVAVRDAASRGSKEAASLLNSISLAPPVLAAISSATPKAGTFDWIWKPKKTLKPGKYYYYIEVNKSFDDNDQDKNEISGDLKLNLNGAPKPNGISQYVVYWGETTGKPIKKGKKI